MSRRAPRLRALDRALLVIAGGVTLVVFGIVLLAPGAPWAVSVVAAVGLMGVGALGGVAWGEARARKLRAAHATEVVRLRAELAHRDRLASLGLATAGIVHDLRGPVSAVQMGLQVLALPDLDGAATARVRDNLETSMAHMRTQVDALLDFSRPDGGGAADPASAAQLATRLVDLDGRRRIQALIPPAPGRVPLAEGGLAQVLVNLLDNALKAGRAVEVEGTWGRTGATLRVHDDGPGVAAAERARIFQPFVSDRAPGEGTGLGLHCARALVEEAGGRLTVEDSRLGGACFVVWLPWAEAEVALAS